MSDRSKYTRYKCSVSFSISTYDEEKEDYVDESFNFVYQGRFYPDAYVIANEVLAYMQDNDLYSNMANISVSASKDNGAYSLIAYLDGDKVTEID